MIWRCFTIPAPLPLRSENKWIVMAFPGFFGACSPCFHVSWISMVWPREFRIPWLQDQRTRFIGMSVINVCAKNLETGGGGDGGRGKLCDTQLFRLWWIWESSAYQKPGRCLWLRSSRLALSCAYMCRQCCWAHVDCQGSHWRVYKCGCVHACVGVLSHWIVFFTSFDSNTYWSLVN